MVRLAASAVVALFALQACAPLRSLSGWTTAEAGNDPRIDAISRAQVWMPTKVAARDIKAGPADPRALPYRATIDCKYDPKDLSGASPKFSCVTADGDELKVKYGGNNAEVYAEVVATRLLWALGFGADHMYPVRVICRGCPEMFGGIARDDGAYLFDPATVERKMPGRELTEKGWAWTELDGFGARSPAAPRAHRDALKLLAVFIQHTDTKPQQQRVLCLGDRDADDESTSCERPFLMINDLGLTFGRANAFNVNAKGMNLVEWASTPVWREGGGCVGNLPKSITGTLDNPVISEEGRQFLATLLMQLSDAQIRDLFEVARVTLRLRDPVKARSGFATVDEWVDAFKAKRAQIVDKRCA
jgi:hypothetical protein